LISRNNLQAWVPYLIGICISVALVTGILLVSWRQAATTHQKINNKPIGELVAGRRFGQTFQASFSGLYQIDVLLATYNRQNNGPVIFHLTEGVGGTELVTIEIEASQIQDNAPRRFAFEPIPDSADREFYFYLEAPNAKRGNAITIWETDYDSYPAGRAYADDEPTVGDLRFVAYYRSNPRETWHNLSERIRTWHPILWQIRWLVLATIVAFIMGIGILLGESIAAWPRAHE
jgi:hypothetical protein